MNTTVEETTEVTTEAISLLYRELGIVKTIKFLREMGVGGGDYTKERQERDDPRTVNDLIEEIARMKR